MKWKNKGHEFDKVYENISSKRGFYLYGAGDYGRQFFSIIKDEIRIHGFIDQNIENQSAGILGLPCFSLASIRLKKEDGIILTMSQVARVRPIAMLEEIGYQRNVDYYILEDFLSIYYVYRHNKVYFSSISFLPSTACNLNCRHCLNFNPFAKNTYVRQYEDLVEDIDVFFSCVDRIMLFHLSGGEPMLYSHMADTLLYIYEKYGGRIDTLRTVTNGTVVPNDTTLEKLARCNVEITVDDYRKAVPGLSDRFEILIKKLEEYGIKYYINKVEDWIDLAPEKTNYSDWTESRMIEHRSRCNQSWQELRGKKLYNCNYAAYATVAGIAGNQDMEETYDLTAFDPSKKKELTEFRLGYTEKGYTNFCRKCRGFTPENKESVEPAVQAAKELEIHNWAE